MGFFKKFAPKTQTAQATPQTPVSKPAVNPEDIFNQKFESRAAKERKAKEAAQPQSLKEIDPQELSESLKQLEEELAAKPAEKDYHYYDSNPIGTSEVEKAQQQFDADYKIEHEKFVQSHQQELTAVDESEIANGMGELNKSIERRIAEENAEYNISQVSSQELSDIMQNFDSTRMSNMAIPVDNEIAGLTQNDFDAINDFEQQDIHSRDIDPHDDEIESMPQENIMQKMQEFNQKYSDAQ